MLTIQSPRLYRNLWLLFVVLLALMLMGLRWSPVLIALAFPALAIGLGMVGYGWFDHLISGT